MFNDSLENNLETIKELIQGVPPSERDRAKRAAVAVEKVVTALIRDNQGNPAVGLGMAFAVFTIAQRLAAAPQEGDSDKRLIHLLS